jgi:transcriptional regulator with XRE-family HTH domain
MTIKYKSYHFKDKDPIIDALRTLVEDSGLSWEQISELSGVSATTLYNWFQGATISPRFCTLEAVARSLGASLQFGRRGVNVIPLKRVAR